METELRVGLYSQVSDREISFNPVEPEPYDIVDLTIDVTNFTRIYHTRTECVREALEGANLVVTDSEPLANIIRKAVPRARVNAVPFGAPQVVEAVSKKGKPVIGLLNHSAETQMNNLFSRPLLNALDKPLLIYGEGLDGLDLDIETTLDFAKFCSECDVLLLPSMPGVINSPTAAMGAMVGAGVVVLAHNTPGYYGLDGSTGVYLLPYSIDAWLAALATLAHRSPRLTAMQERNRVFALRQNRDSLALLNVLLDQPVARRKPLSKGCGCEGKKKADLPKELTLEELTPADPPNQVEESLVIEKE